VRDLSTHFVPRAQGGEALALGANVWYFTGRRRALEAICTWLGAKPAAPNLLVVVGRPGAGYPKSVPTPLLSSLVSRRFRIAAIALSGHILGSSLIKSIAVHFTFRRCWPVGLRSTNN
jgi:hypothetical protein